MNMIRATPRPWKLTFKPAALKQSSSELKPAAPQLKSRKRRVGGPAAAKDEPPKKAKLSAQSKCASPPPPRYHPPHKRPSVGGPTVLWPSHR